MSRTVSVGFLLLVLCFPVSVNAVGKSTVDPNVGGRKNSVVAPSNDVTQRITYSAKRKTVLSIVNDLSGMTGVTLKAGFNTQDWQVRDRRMNIFAKDIPLQSLMDSIARTMKFQWNKHEDVAGVVSYRLCMNREMLLGKEGQRYMQQERLEKRQVEARQEFCTALEDASQMSANDLEKLQGSSPYVYAMAKMGWADFLAGLFQQVPNARQAWLSGTEFVLNAASLSDTMNAQLTKLPAGIGGKAVDSLVLILNSSESSTTPLSNIGNVVLRAGGRSIETDFLDPSGDLARASARLWGAKGVLDPAHTADASQVQQLKVALDQAKASLQADFTEPLVKNPDDPELSKEIAPFKCGVRRPAHSEYRE